MMLHRFARPTFCHLCLLLLASTDALACSGRLHIEVQNSAVYTLDYGAIVATQPQMKDCPGSDLVLFNHGKEVPIRISQTSDGRFGPGSRIVWVGQALHGPQGWYDPYSTVNVYILAAAPGAHARMRDLPAPAATAAKSATLHRRLHFEQENLMLRLNGSEMKPGDEPDVWQWAKLTPIDPQPFAFAFDLPDANLRAGKDSTVALTLNFRGVSNVIATKGQTKPADHRVEVSINGKLLQTLEWDGRSEFRKTLSLPTALLKDKANALSLRVPRRDAPDDPNNFIVDVVMFNWMEIAYPIHGEVAASAAAFTATPELPIELNDAAGTPELYAADGSYRALTAIGKSRYLAAGVADNVDLYTVAAGHASTPALVRAVTDRDLRAAEPARCDPAAGEVSPRTRPSRRGGECRRCLRSIQPWHCASARHPRSGRLGYATLEDQAALSAAGRRRQHGYSSRCAQWCAERILVFALDGTAAEPSTVRPWFPGNAELRLSAIGEPGTQP
jgi:hypothetical protein